MSHTKSLLCLLDWCVLLCFILWLDKGMLDKGGDWHPEARIDIV